MRSFITGALVRATRQLAQRYIWTHVGIAQTFRLSPSVPSFFQKDMAVSDVGRRTSDAAIAGAVAVAISAANQCFY